jgi:septum formation protein
VIDAKTPLVLGSASPRRLAILEELRLAVRVVAANVDEAAEPGEPAEAYLVRVVRDKLRAVASKIRGERCAALLVADTSVVVDGAILGKPNDIADAERLLRRIVGRTHTVYTRYAIALSSDLAKPARERTVTTRVSMRTASDEEVSGYARSGEGLDKAGAYAVQGLGSFLVERIEGSYANVVGLPACEVVVDLRDLGLFERFP